MAKHYIGSSWKKQNVSRNDFRWAVSGGGDRSQKKEKSVDVIHERSYTKNHI